ncbi:MAG TPA: DUF5667 domain-containing protein [Ktedonobacteraceae bacterium]
MKPLEERLNDRLEQAQWGIGRNGQHPGGFTLPVGEREHDPEVDELVALARRLQQAHQLQVTPDFARQLERRMVRRYAEIQLQRGSRRHSFFSLLRARPALSAVLGICLLFCLLSTGVLALAARVNDPTSPLYQLKGWEQHVQLQLSGSPADQATLDLQFARDRLKTLPSLADTAHASAYRQALADLDQQVNAAATAINELPAGAHHTQLAGELASLKRDAIHVLRGLLARLALPEQLGTTSELARLGGMIPLLRQASLTLPAHPNGRATISFTGLDLQPGAHLLVDGKVIEETGTLQYGQVVFVMGWNGNQHPHSLGILNPDGTATETTAITIKGADTSGTPGGNQNGNGNKPTVTPTPHGNKPPVTPTPHGKQPSGTPIPNH